jgi:outer membrane usher protein
MSRPGQGYVHFPAISMRRLLPLPLTLPLRPCSFVVLSLFAMNGARAASTDVGAPIQTAAVEFNEALLRAPGTLQVDISRFDKGNAALPGVYLVDVYINQTWLGRRRITLRQMSGDANDVQPCFDRDLLEQAGVDLSKLSEQASARLVGDPGGGAQNGVCVTLPELVPDARATFDNGEQRLDVSIPQASMSRQVRGYVDPRYWDDGVPAAILQYNANVFRAESQGTSSTQGYVGLNIGGNWGPWRLRHTGSLTSGSAIGAHYQNVQTSLSRSIVPLKSQLVMGDAFTDGAMFDSVGFRGVRLATDDQMYPESQRGYAPVIHGVANSNAQVQVRQNGNIIYTANVAAGPFEITDLYPTGYGGDLDVTVTEANGSTEVFSVPYASAVNAVRPGITRFSVTAGEYRDAQLSEKPWLAQATMQHGFTNAVTGYGGITVAQGYAAAVVGMALNTGVGAFGLDITQANTELPHRASWNGQSVRIAYTKSIDPTSTSISVLAYRYSSSGYLGLQNAMQLRYIPNSTDPLTSGIPRGRFQATVNQALPAGLGSIYVSGSTQNYWNRGGQDTQFQAGYNNNFRRISYGVSISRQYDVTLSKWDNQIMLTVGIPLGSGVHAPYLSTNLQRDSDGATTLQESANGALGADNDVTYGVNAGYDTARGAPAAASIGANAAYVSPYATVAGNASTSTGYTQYGASASGGVVAYGGGVAFTPSMGDTVAIVEASGAAGARVTNGSGLRIDPWGHAIVSNLMPFEDNEVEIDPKGLPMSVELKSSLEHVAPTQGAVVRLKFEAEGGGQSVLMRATLPDGAPLPFGAQVSDASGVPVGTVAQAGRIALRSLKARSGELDIRWGNAAEQQCSLSYVLPPVPSGNTTWTMVDATCVKR